MAKDTFYFSHDYNARNDPKLQKVLMKLGHAGKSVFWDLIEMLYEQDGYLNLAECENYAFALRTDIECIKSLINDFDLFQKNKDKFWSKSVLERIKIRDNKSQKAKESAKKRWQKPVEKPEEKCEVDANALRTLSDGNAIKESKVKEIDIIPLEIVLSFFKQTKTFRQLAEKYRLADLADRFIEFYNIRADLEFKNKTKEDIVLHFSHALPGILSKQPVKTNNSGYINVAN